MSVADVDTRRRSAIELVRGLSVHWESEMVGIFSGYIQQLLEVL